MVCKLGRSDRYLILKKPFDNIEVRQCAMALTERWKISRTDVLTGLLNRRAFRSHLDLEWSRTTRHNLPLACAMLDLDDFKRVNDTLGHLVGDSALAAVAQTLKAHCRASDLVCRYGGDEFCVLLPHTNQEQAARWAEHVRQALAAAPIEAAGRAIDLAVSIGLAERLPDDDGPHRLVGRADRALIGAKNSFRDHAVVFAATAPPAEGGSPQDSIVTCDALAPLVSPKHGDPARHIVQFAQLPPGCAPVVDVAMAPTIDGLTQAIIGAGAGCQASGPAGCPLPGEV
jgi:diguanylate cyclase (GGDEF)-like protein